MKKLLITLNVVLLVNFAAAQDQTTKWKEGRETFLKRINIISEATFSIAKECFEYHKAFYKEHNSNYRFGIDHWYLAEDAKSKDKRILLVGSSQLASFKPNVFLMVCELTESHVVDKPRTGNSLWFEKRLNRSGISLFGNDVIFENDHPMMRRLESR